MARAVFYISTAGQDDSRRVGAIEASQGASDGRDQASSAMTPAEARAYLDAAKLGEPANMRQIT